MKYNKAFFKKALNFFFFFLKIGFMAYGGPAMLGFIKKEVVFKNKLITENDFNDGIALVNVIPGATNSQMVAYIGYKLKKSRGALIAFSAFILPAFIEMLVFTILYKESGSIGLFMYIFKVLEAVITAILLNTAIMFGSRIIKEWRLDIIALITLAMLVLKLNILLILLIAIMLTFLLFLIGKKFWPFKERKNPSENKADDSSSISRDMSSSMSSNIQSSELKNNNHGNLSKLKNTADNSLNNFDKNIINKKSNADKITNNNTKINLTKTKTKSISGSFFRTYVGFFVAAALIIISLILSYLFKRNLFLAGLSLTKASVIGFGGAIPMLTVIQYDMVNVLKIFSQKQIVDALVLGQITPGPIMITSTFIGYYVYGFTGSILCTITAFYPSFAIFSLVAPKYEIVKNNKYVKLAVRGIMGMFVGMLLFFLYSVGREAIKGYISGIFVSLSFIAIRLKVKEIYIIAAAVVISIILYFLKVKFI
ncbi:MAG: chromate transporter [Cyanobacteria bacterium]|nr:chromate transporter [Cyanobacteriota bacterium]